MKLKMKLWICGTMLLTFSTLTIVALDRIGIGPNLGFPFGYYGKLNRVLSHIKDNTALEVIETTLHRDIELEDFYIMVRTQEGSEISLQFEEGDTRTINDLLKELKIFRSEVTKAWETQPTGKR